MHELPITENILKIALRHADSAGATKITDIHLVIGKLASIVDQSVRFYWDIISEDTIAEGASLHFSIIPAQILCLDCDLRYHPEEGELGCPDCSSLHVNVIAGEEFRVEAIEIESPDENPAMDSGE